MNSSKCLLIFLVSVLGFVSCKKDFLEVEDNSFLNRQSYVTDIDKVEEFLNGVYVVFEGQLIEDGVGAAYPELAADNLKPLTTGTLSLASHYSWTQQPNETSVYRVRQNHTNMNSYWLGAYHIIRACNFVIE